MPEYYLQMMMRYMRAAVAQQKRGAAFARDICALAEGAGRRSVMHTVASFAGTFFNSLPPRERCPCRGPTLIVAAMARRDACTLRDAY